MESLTPQNLPRIIPANEVIPTMERIVAELRSARNTVAQTVEASTARFENVIKPFIEVENRTQGEVGVIAMLRYASPDREARDASEEAVKLWRECEAEFTARQDIFLLVKAAKNKSEQLDLEAAKYLDSLFTDFKRCGHEVLDADQIKHYLDRRNHIDNLRREYNQNIRDEDGQLAFSLDELEGVPQQDLDRFSRSSEPDEDKVRYVQLRRADLGALLDHARNPTTRRRIHVADANKLPQNVGLFKQIIVLRDENARLLGYDSHAAFKLEERLAKTPEWVVNLLDSLERVLLPQGRREMDALLEMRRSHLAEDPHDSSQHPGTMPPWDYRYYVSLAEDNVHVDHAKISEYFPLQSTVSAILSIFASYLQFVFVPISAELLEGFRWHEDVEVWSVWDDSKGSKGEFIGYLYADLLCRPNKYRGSQNVNLQCGYLRDDGSRVYPATILMCSFPRPTTSGCALLRHHEIVSLFHELGHAIHDLVSRTSYVKFHGHRAPRDFVEAPAIFLENWCWMKDELKHMSCHYTRLDPKYLETWQSEHPGDPVPPERIPDEMLDSLIQSRNLNRAMWFLRQLFFARFDMAVYHVQSHDACSRLDVTGLYHDLEKLMFVHNPDPRDRGHPQSDFGHLISGYDAGYYSYLSAHVIAADLFETAFAENPRSQASWARYRRGILEYGGSRDVLQFLEEFLGHPPNPGVLLRGFGKLDQGAVASIK